MRDDTFLMAAGLAMPTMVVVGLYGIVEFRSQMRRRHARRLQSEQDAKDAMERMNAIGRKAMADRRAKADYRPATTEEQAEYESLFGDLMQTGHSVGESAQFLIRYGHGDVE